DLSLYITVGLLFYVFCTWTSCTHMYTLSLHDALPICHARGGGSGILGRGDRSRRQPFVGVDCSVDRVPGVFGRRAGHRSAAWWRSEEHTSELQSLRHLVCRLLLGKKKQCDAMRPWPTA